METVKLSIPSMKSTHCQMTVSGVVKSVRGTVKNLKPAYAEIELADGLSEENIVSAIERAGYHVDEILN